MTERKHTTAETRPEEIALVIPDDPEQSVYRFIIVAAKRARQLQTGVRPKVPVLSRKMTRVAVEEVRRGLIAFVDPETAPPEEEPVTDQ